MIIMVQIEENGMFHLVNYLKNVVQLKKWRLNY